MNITIYGAGNEVTGSCYLLETGTTRLLVDCGLFQGSERLERMNVLPRAIVEQKLDAVLLTHGHLDHCGRLPLLKKLGYRGPIYTTPPTADIARLILTDCAKIQQDDAERENKQRAHEKRHRNDRHRIEPLFSPEDVESVCKQFKPIFYNHWFEIADGIKAQFVEAGHILGSACVELVIDQAGARRHLVFSGDLGQPNVPILCDPARIETADLVFMESTYGDRDHRSLKDTVQEFHEVIVDAIEARGKVLIPSFAVGRTQLLLYYFAQMFRRHDIEPLPIYLDSPMAIAATDLYAKNYAFMDEEARQLHTSGQFKHDLKTLHTCVTVEESKAINDIPGPCVVIAGAGMCNAGRILHHLQHNLGDASTRVLIVGYQAKGSLGRNLIEGASEVKMFGETIKVRAKVKGMGGFSAHAGQSELLSWLHPMAMHKPRVVLVHGESHPISELSFKIKERFNIDVEAPKIGDVVTI